MKKIVIYLTLAILVIIRAGFAESPPGDREKVQQESPLRLIYAPLAYYSPETHIAYGAAGSLVFRIDPGQGNDRPSSVSALIMHTQLHQFRLVLSQDIYLNRSGLYIQSELLYQDYPDKFFGIGSRVSVDDEEVYTARSFEFNLAVEKELFGNFSLGARVQWDSWELTKVVEGGLLDTGTLFGIGGGQVAGLGLIASWDTRNRFFSASRGTWVRLRVDFFEKVLGGDFDFSRIIVDARHYRTLFRNHVLAVQAKAELQTGEVPFQYLARFGGMYSMRGYYDGRFRDKDMIMAQMEYRLPLSGRFTLVAFGSAGNVAPKLHEMDLARPLLAGGVGLRFVYDKKENIVVRMDIGFGKDSSGLYFSIYEAF